MVITQITGPNALPITLTDAKNNLRVTGADDDQTIQRLMRSATDNIEMMTGQRLVTQTWDLYRDCLSEEMQIPYPPLQSVSYVKYLDADGAWQTLDTSLYTVDTYSFPGRIYRTYAATWPTVQYTPNSVQIRFVAGYGTAQQVPARFVDMILLDMKRNYEPTEDKYFQNLSDRLEGMIMKDRVTWL